MMKRVSTYESGGESEDEFIDSSLSPRDYNYEHMTSRKKRRGVIEKRRRDRINHCLMELRRLVPQAISKEGSTKLEKAEILQMTVDHLRSIQQTDQDPNHISHSWPMFDAHASGFRECIDEISRYLISIEGFDVQHPLRLRLLSHLECFTERSLSPSSHHTWPTIPQQTPSAFAPPPLTSYSSSPMSYHHPQASNQNFHIHPYHHRPPIDTSCQLPSSSCI